MGMMHTLIKVAITCRVAFCILLFGMALYLPAAAIMALKRHIDTAEIREEKEGICMALGEALKEHRLRCEMTQEFVAKKVGVSRQAVSKWEAGASDPSASNLLVLASLYGVSSEELLRAADAGREEPGAGAE